MAQPSRGRRPWNSPEWKKPKSWSSTWRDRNQKSHPSRQEGGFVAAFLRRKPKSAASVFGEDHFSRKSIFRIGIFERTLNPSHCGLSGFGPREGSGGGEQANHDRGRKNQHRRSKRFGLQGHQVDNA